MPQIYLDVIGYIAAFLTTIAFLPQTFRTIKYKQTKDISLVMYLLFCTGVFVWLVYGIVLANIPLIIANGLTLALSTTVLALKLRFG